MKKNFNSRMRSILSLMLFFLTLTSYAQILYTQNTAVHGDVLVKEDLEYGYGAAVSHAADDFEVPAGQTWTITQIDLPGRYLTGGLGDYYSAVGAVRIKFLADDSGKPGAEIADQNIEIAGIQYDPNLELVIPGGVTLPSGIYWMAIYTDIWGELWQSWFWKSTDTLTRHPALFRNNHPDLPDVYNWTPVGEVFSHPDVDMLFTLHGTSDGVAAPAAPYGLTVTHPASTFNLTWRDNSTNESGFIIERSTDNINYIARATVGYNITTYIDADSFDFANRYYYRVRATGATGNSLASEIAFSDTFEMLYKQDEPGEAAGTESYQSRGYLGDSYGGVKGADDFIVPENQVWTIKKVNVLGSLTNQYIAFENVIVEIISDGGPITYLTSYDTTVVTGHPTTTYYKSSPVLIPYADQYNPTFEITLPQVLTFTHGHYWISVYPSTKEDQQWIWSGTPVIHNVRAFNDHKYMQPVGEWKPLDDEIAGSADLLFTLFGSLTTTDSLPAPIAKPALYVTHTSFTARWTSVAGADHYELDVIRTPDSTFLAGYENKIVNDTSFAVTGTKDGRHYFYVVRAVNENGESVNSNSIYVAPTKNLTLRTVCSDDPQTYRRWKIINNNPFAVDVTWQVPGTAQTGTLSATSGDSFFITQKVDGINYALITWHNDQLTELSSLKSATWKPCSSTLARGATINDDEVGEAELSLTVQTSPNPVVDKFNLLVSSPDDGDVDVEIINIQGQHVLNTRVRGNASSEVDGTSFTSGLYIIRATQNRSVQTIKMLKK
ncbi:MAG TPA: T9SS type A sorting domain-containing protein [Cyclobacteriaceae bacterium]|nr:T9SS type A sorting domain-containing protein [Cyclobacteriaceae bacterium]